MNLRIATIYETSKEDLESPTIRNSRDNYAKKTQDIVRKKSQNSSREMLDKTLSRSSFLTFDD